MPSRLLKTTFATLALGLSSLAIAQQPTIMPASGTANGQPVVRAVAYIYDSIPVTRDELADFLIARGGHEKVELLINRKIIDVECAKRKITVTPLEMEAVLNDDLKGLGFEKEQFLAQLLPRYNKTYYEWMEDVIKPRIALRKLCEGDVKVTDEDVKKIYENLYGEKRRVQMIMWPLDEVKVAQNQFDLARKNQEEFDRVARAQANPALAAAAGHVLPICRYQAEKDPMIEKIAYELKVGETSQMIECRGQKCWVMLKLHEIIPPDNKKTFETEKEALRKIALDKKIEEYIPVYFGKLKEAAKPTKPLISAPAEWQFNNPTGVKKSKAGQ